MGENPVIHVPNELFAPAESSCFSGEYDLKVLDAGPDRYEFQKPCTWQVVVSNTGDAFLVTGTVEGVATTSCARCLESAQFPLAGTVEAYFLQSEEGSVPEDLDDDEFDVLPEDHLIDLAPLLDAALLLELPLIPLCDEDCFGLCSSCGHNLNEGPCACKKDEDVEEKAALHPFAALKDYPFEGSEAKASDDQE